MDPDPEVQLTLNDKRRSASLDAYDQVFRREYQRVHASIEKITSV
jgi:hypothetical protein